MVEKVSSARKDTLKRRLLFLKAAIYIWFYGIRMEELWLEVGPKVACSCRPNAVLNRLDWSREIYNCLFSK